MHDTTVILHIDTRSLNGVHQSIDKHPTTKIALVRRHVPPRYRCGHLSKLESALIAGKQKRFVGQWNNFPLEHHRIFVRHSQGSDPLEMLRRPLGVQPDFLGITTHTRGFLQIGDKIVGGVIKTQIFLQRRAARAAQIHLAARHTGRATSTTCTLVQNNTGAGSRGF